MAIETVIIWMIFDALLINAGVLLSFWLRFAGDIPPANLSGYESLYLIITAVYLLVMYLKKLYSDPSKITLYDNLTRSVKGVVYATLGAIALAVFLRPFLRDTQADAFPTTVFIISIFVNSIIIFLFRLVVRKYILDIKFFNRLVEFVIWRFLDGIIIAFSYYAALIIRFGSLTIPQRNLSAYNAFIIPMVLIYAYFIYKMLLHKKREEDWFGSVIWRNIKVSTYALFSFLILMWVFRESRIAALPVPALVIGYFLNLVFLSAWHLLIRKYNWEIEVDLEAEDDEEDLVDD